MLAAAHQAADAELADSGFKRAAEPWQPMETVRSGQDVGLLGNLPQGAPITNEIGSRRAAYSSCQADPGSVRKYCDLRPYRTVALLEQAEEPVGRQPLQHAAIVHERLHV